MRLVELRRSAPADEDQFQVRFVPESAKRLEESGQVLVGRVAADIEHVASEAGCEVRCSGRVASRC